MKKRRARRLKPGTRIGSYEIDFLIGRGSEAAVYAVREVPTDAPRAMRIVQHHAPESVRDRVHTAWFFEQLGPTGVVAKYYHMGQWFLTDDDGLFYYVFERLEGETLDRWLGRKRGRMTACDALTLAAVLAGTISKVHTMGYALGDLYDENLIVSRNGRVIKVCDCNPGVADHPNKDFKADLLRFRELVAQIFGRSASSEVYRQTTAIIRTNARRKVSGSVMAAIHSELLALADGIAA